jgi:hypothetical protein
MYCFHLSAMQSCMGTYLRQSVWHLGRAQHPDDATQIGLHVLAMLV